MFVCLNWVMRVTTDLHTHTTYSPDARSSVREMCQQAAHMGLSAIAFTEHKEWGGRFYAPFKRLDKYFRDIEACRRDFSREFVPSSHAPLLVLSGVEMGNPHEYVAKATKLLEENQFDVKIASLHRLYGTNIHDKRCFRRRDLHDVMTDYFEATEEMIRDFEFDILGHFDRILWRPTLESAEYDIYQVEKSVRSLFSTALEQNVMIELNTKVFRTRPSWRSTLHTMLGWYREAGGTQLLVNSDAHHKRNIQTRFDEAVDLLDEVGLMPAEGLAFAKQKLL